MGGCSELAVAGLASSAGLPGKYRVSSVDIGRDGGIDRESPWNAVGIGLDFVPGGELGLERLVLRLEAVEGFEGLFAALFEGVFPLGAGALGFRGCDGHDAAAHLLKSRHGFPAFYGVDFLQALVAAS